MEPARRPGPPTPRPEEADVGAGFKPARARTSRTAQGDVAPLGPTNRPPQAKPHRGTRKEARPPTARPEEADVGAGFKPARARTGRTAQGEVAPLRSQQPPPTSQTPPWNPQGGPAPHATSRRGRRRGGFQTRPRPHQQNSPRRSRPPRSHQPPPTSQSPPWPTVESARRPGPPTPRPEEADVGRFKEARGFQTRPCPHQQNSPRRSRPPRSRQPPTQPNPTEPQKGPGLHAASRRGRRRGGFKTRPRPHQENSPRRSRPPSVPATAHHKPIPTVEPARRPDPHAASRRGRRRGGFQTRPRTSPCTIWLVRPIS